MEKRQRSGVEDAVWKEVVREAAGDIWKDQRRSGAELVEGCAKQGEWPGEVLCMFEEKQESQRIWTTVSKGVE